MNVFKLVFSAKACVKVAVRNVKIREAIVFLIDPYYKVLNDTYIYIMLLNLCLKMFKS